MGGLRTRGHEGGARGAGRAGGARGGAAVGALRARVGGLRRGRVSTSPESSGPSSGPRSRISSRCTSTSPMPACVTGRHATRWRRCRMPSAGGRRASMCSMRLAWCSPRSAISTRPSSRSNGQGRRRPTTPRRRSIWRPRARFGTSRRFARTAPPRPTGLARSRNTGRCSGWAARWPIRRARASGAWNRWTSPA